eukprot:TRINITY_DN11620_c0_g7_i1.p1 TRINITY_DN11620_c0_g7~~TRINITY_DN11620_c0_g7_i1.p1  ORF type:complete len:473 (-),score=106.70 TRINITY_DN11620_c0_g7_i1:62-1480(-)
MSSPGEESPSNVVSPAPQKGVLSPVKRHTEAVQPPPPPKDGLSEGSAPAKPKPPPTPPSETEDGGLEGIGPGLHHVFTMDDPSAAVPLEEKSIFNVDKLPGAIPDDKADEDEDIITYDDLEQWPGASPEQTPMTTFYRDEFKETKGEGELATQAAGSSSSAAPAAPVPPPASSSASSSSPSAVKEAPASSANRAAIPPVPPPGSGGDGKGLFAIFEAAVAEGEQSVAAGNQAPPPTPFLQGGIGPNESYFNEANKVRSEFQKIAFEQLREWDDEVEARFTAKQAVNLVRILNGHRYVPPPPRKQSWYEFITTNLIRFSWLVLASLMLLMPMLIAGVLSTETKPVGDIGNTVTKLDESPTAMAGVVTVRSLMDLQHMKEAELRLIRDCTFQHRGAFHRMHVASLVRNPVYGVFLTSADESMLRIDGTAVTFSRPFVGDQPVDVQETRGDARCTFTAMADASDRSTPFAPKMSA